MIRKRTILSRTLKVFGFIMLPVTLAVFASTYIPPDIFWPAGIIALVIPHLLILHLLLAVYWLFRRAVWILIPLALLAVGYGHIRSTVSLHEKKEITSVESLITTLSYNVNYFKGAKPREGEPSAGNASDIAAAILDTDTDVLCLQKYPGESQEIDSVFTALARAGYSRHFPAETDSATFDGGVVIFSRLPVSDKGEFSISSLAGHRAAWVDVARSDGETIRVINLHLPSINTTETGPYARKEKLTRDELKTNLRMRQEARTQELERIMDFLADSPYPVIICGDFNETPYSYTYRKLNAFYDNAFVNAGRGFGITYQPFSPFLLRIDHQFYDDRLTATSFRTMRDIKFSHHFPIRATYSLDEE
ncbi:MAG: endonuclease/exonuclease/phosphatase family protein [Cyclobacteriaceae bacterium]